MSTSSTLRRNCCGGGKKTGFLRHLYIKCIILPRQARDKHRENSKKARFLAGTRWNRRGTSHGKEMRKRSFLPLFMLGGMIVLPRQARDEHRKSTQQRDDRFLSAGRTGRTSCAHCASRCAEITPVTCLSRAVSFESKSNISPRQAAVKGA
jgi:hypothetical protein